MSNQRADFAEFYRRSRNDCLRAVLVNVGDQDTAQDLVAEAFARAWASWRTVSGHPAPAAWVVRTALNAGVSRWRRRHREIPLPDPGTLASLPAADGADDDPVDPRVMAALLRLPLGNGRSSHCACSSTWTPAGPRRCSASRRAPVTAHLARAIAALRHDLMPVLPQETSS